MSGYALLIGINYVGQDAELSGCANDARALKEFLVAVCGYLDANITMMLDDGDASTPVAPTRANMVSGIAETLQKAVRGDKVVMSYSGHGGQTGASVARRAQESDGKDEYLYPVDASTAGVLLDDTLKELLLKHTKPGVQVTILTDACHSGTVWDMPMNYIVQRNTVVPLSEPRPDKRWRSLDIVAISGCLDRQTSADAYIDETPCGAMTNAFLRSMALYRNVNTSHLLLFVNLLLSAQNYAQHPQVSTSRALTKSVLSAPFIQRIAV